MAYLKDVLEAICYMVIIIYTYRCWNAFFDVGEEGMEGLYSVKCSYGLACKLNLTSKAMSGPLTGQPRLPFFLYNCMKVIASRLIAFTSQLLRFVVLKLSMEIS